MICSHCIVIDGRCFDCGARIARWGIDRKPLDSEVDRLERELAAAKSTLVDVQNYSVKQLAAVTAERDAARAEVESTRREIVDCIRSINSYIEDLTSARTEVEALREDAERYRWFRNPLNYVLVGPTFVWNEAIGRYIWKSDHLDAAIDAARKA